MMQLLTWDIYEIQPGKAPITGAMFRGRIRKLCLEQDQNVLVENAQDIDGAVRFAVIHGESPKPISDYVRSIRPTANITCIKKAVANPVLSKLKVNIESRYTLHMKEIIDTIINFWFEETTPEQHFKKDDVFDQLIREKFFSVYENIVDTNAADYRADANSYLAAILVLDQFSRNMFRGDAKSFAADELALQLAAEAIDKGYDLALPVEQRGNIYLPYMHSESKDVHKQALELFTKLGNESYLKYEHMHKDIIDRFGRYPHRNEVLGRESTEEEKEFLKEHSGF